MRGSERCSDCVRSAWQYIALYPRGVRVLPDPGYVRISRVVTDRRNCLFIAPPVCICGCGRFLHVQLLERELYLDVLDTAFACASSGAGCVVVVSGEAAIGKTALSQHFLARHRPRPFATGELKRIAPVVVLRAEVSWLRGQPVDVGEELEPTYELARMRGDRTRSRLLETGNTPLAPDKRWGAPLSRRRRSLTRAMSRPAHRTRGSSSA